MISSQPAIPIFGASHRSVVLAARARKKNSEAHSELNTLDQALKFAHSYSAEIRQDAKARRIYRSFLALTHNQFEALLAFSIWKVRGHSFSFE